MCCTDQGIEGRAYGKHAENYLREETEKTGSREESHATIVPKPSPSQDQGSDHEEGDDDTEDPMRELDQNSRIAKLPAAPWPRLATAKSGIACCNVTSQEY